jgi:hypothetical protein
MRLPVSGQEVRFRAPDGNDDLAILEAAGSALEQALAVIPLLARLPESNCRKRGAESKPAPWEAMTVTDLEAALLGLRRFLFGDTVICLYRDPSHPCEVRMEVEFSITALLDEVKPRMPHGVRTVKAAPSWYGFETATARGLEFRLPTAADQLESMSDARGAGALAERCVKGAKGATQISARAEKAMEAMSPAVSQSLEGSCPECGKPVSIPLYVPQLVMNELRDGARGVYGEIDLIAGSYHWEEAVILALPRSRRKAYAEAIRNRMRSGE